MEDQIYETSEMIAEDHYIFISWFKREIGTDYEVDKVEDFKYVVTCFELTHEEVQLCRDAENEVLNGASLVV